MVLASFVASLCITAAGSAQVLVVAEQNLQFGLLTPGVPAAVASTDVARRAAYTIDGRGRFTLTFQLPAQLSSPEGGTIPLVFGATDGRVEIRHRITIFDPAAGVNIRINPADRSASVYLGGRAQPGATARAGSYTATIVMIVAETGT
jgi:hypothetical protein